MVIGFKSRKDQERPEQPSKEQKGQGRVRSRRKGEREGGNIKEMTIIVQ